HPGLRRPTPVRIDCTGHTLPDEVPALAHRSRLGSSFMPAETGSTFCEALAHGARRKWPACIGIDVGVVEQAQFDWINSGRVGEFVHRTLKREMSNRFVRRAQGGRSVTFHMNDFVIRPNALARRPQRPRA